MKRKTALAILTLSLSILAEVEFYNTIIVDDSTHVLENRPLKFYYETHPHVDPELYSVIETIFSGTALVKFELKSDSLFLREVRKLNGGDIDTTNYLPHLFSSPFCSWLNEELFIKKSSSSYLQLKIQNGLVADQKNISHKKFTRRYSIQWEKQYEVIALQPTCSCPHHRRVQEAGLRSRLRGKSQEEIQDSLDILFEN